MLEAFFDFTGNPLLRSMTHFGGAGFIFRGVQSRKGLWKSWRLGSIKLMP